MSVPSTGLSDEEKERRADQRRLAYSASELAKKLGVSEATIWRARKRGQLKAIKLGGRTLFVADSLDGLFANAA